MDFKCFAVLVVLSVVQINAHYVQLRCRPKGRGSFHCYAEIPEAEILEAESGKEITFMPEKDIPLDKVSGLDFQAGGLDKFPSEIFKQLQNLRDLTVSWAKIATFSTSNLSGASKLTCLKIIGCTIGRISANAFSEASKLNTLNVIHNQIGSIDDEAFTSTKLTSLNLKSNKLTSVRPKMFSGAKKLKNIYLQNNLIDTIKKHTFDLKNLETIDLSHNQLKKLPDNLYEGASSLMSLRLNDNQLKSVLAAVEKAPELCVLHLENNLNLQENILQNLGRLKSIKCLFLDNANQASLPETGTVMSDKLTHLSLKTNKLSDSKFLEKLKGLKALTHIFIDDNDFTELNGLDSIEEDFKDLSIFSGKKNNWTADCIELSIDLCDCCHFERRAV